MSNFDCISCGNHEPYVSDRSHRRCPHHASSILMAWNVTGHQILHDHTLNLSPSKHLSEKRKTYVHPDTLLTTIRLSKHVTTATTCLHIQVKSCLSPLHHPLSLLWNLTSRVSHKCLSLPHTQTFHAHDEQLHTSMYRWHRHQQQSARRRFTCHDPAAQLRQAASPGDAQDVHAPVTCMLVLRGSLQLGADGWRACCRRPRRCVLLHAAAAVAVAAAAAAAGGAPHEVPQHVPPLDLAGRGLGQLVSNEDALRHLRRRQQNVTKVSGYAPMEGSLVPALAVQQC